MTNGNNEFDQIRALLAETVQLTRSNAVSIQSLTDRITELTFVQEEAAEERRELREVTERLSGMAEGIIIVLVFDILPLGRSRTLLSSSPGKEKALPPSPPLRTTRKRFRLCSSSLSNALFRTRLCYV